MNTHYPRLLQGAPPPPSDVDLARLLETASRHGVRVWRADRTGELRPIPNPTKGPTR